MLRPDGSSLLHLAVLNPSLELVRILIDAGCDPCIADERGETPLFLAIHSNDLKIARELLKSGAYPLKRDNYGCNVFHLAALGDITPELIILLCEAVHSQDDLEKALFEPSKHGVSAIETAIFTKSVTTLKVFLSFLTPDRLNFWHRDLIRHCIKCNTCTEIVDCFVDSGYDFRRELSRINLQDCTSDPNHNLISHLRNLHRFVPSLLHICKLKLLANLSPKDRRNMECFLAMHLPYLLSQKICISF